MKLKYIISTLVLFTLSTYSALYPEKYHVLISVILGSMCILSIAALAVDRKEK